MILLKQLNDRFQISLGKDVRSQISDKDGYIELYMVFIVRSFKVKITASGQFTIPPRMQLAMELESDGVIAIEVEENTDRLTLTRVEKLFKNADTGDRELVGLIDERTTRDAMEKAIRYTVQRILAEDDKIWVILEKHRIYISSAQLIMYLLTCKTKASAHKGLLSILASDVLEVEDRDVFLQFLRNGASEYTLAKFIKASMQVAGLENRNIRYI